MMLINLIKYHHSVMMKNGGVRNERDYTFSFTTIFRKSD